MSLAMGRNRLDTLSSTLTILTLQAALSLVLPTALRLRFKVDLSQSSPETQSAITHRQHRRRHPTPLQVPENADPRLGRLAIVIFNGDDLFAAFTKSPA
jgi:hypothetical protein